MKNILKIAHRGFSELYPENTITSFNRAVEEGAEMIEFDVHLSREGVPMVIHDDTIERTSNGRGFVKDMTFSELRAFDYSISHPENGFCLIPTLDEVISLLKGRVLMNIEIKNLPVKYRGIEERIVSIVMRHDCVDSVVISSFDHHCLDKVKSINPRLMVGMFYSASWLLFEDELKLLKPYSIHPDVRAVDWNQIYRAKELGCRIFPWVARDRETIERLLDPGIVDGVMVNDLRLFN